MRTILPIVPLALAISLAACSAERGVEAGTGAGAALDAIAAIEPVTEPAGAADAIPAAGDARMDGYGTLAFGLTAEAAHAAWTGNRLEPAGDLGDPAACHHLVPAGQEAGSGLAFMFEDHLFVRYGTGSDAITAPGGGRVGMEAAALEGLYGGRLQSTPHKYVEAGRVLTSPEDGGAQPSRLVFELDADGRVTRWRVGLAPQVGYVEGCG